MSKPKYDSSVARMAGNIAAGFVNGLDTYLTDRQAEVIVGTSVKLARAIVAEVQRTEPAVEPVVTPTLCGARVYAGYHTGQCDLASGHIGKCSYSGLL